ncbi:hypothetical protein BJ165DRAFT_1616460 [Panaeolus papilionaceus]|nr:hypothetical protein BJ165DRAFT_1616460 [Panaeolus papilionaceus]
MSEEPRYDYLKILGPLRVEPVTPKELKGQRVRVCILMGPTGSGKSAFIEALAPQQGLSISKDSINSVTQNVLCYSIVNLHDSEHPVILMDTPGLLDPRISESRVVSMISNELDALRTSVEMAVVTLCYFHAIDVARVGGTKRSAVEFLKGFAQTFKANNVNIVTTMWNKLWKEKQTTDAEQRFNALQVEIYKSLPSLNVSLDKFDSTAASTLSILDACRHGWYHTTKKQKINLPQYDHLVLQGIMSRIQDAQLALELLPITAAKEGDVVPLYDLACNLYQFDEEAYRSIFPKAPCPPTFTHPRKSRMEISFQKSSERPSKFVKHVISFMESQPLVDEVGQPPAVDRQPQVINSEQHSVQFESPAVLNIDPDLAAVISKLQNLTVFGDISVERVAVEIPENAKVYVIMGFVGAGKSRLVESLAGEAQDLGISKDQLASYTHTVEAYHVVNILNSGCPIILLDTPGFADHKMSDMEMMSMIPAWMEQNGIHFFHQILFLSPINSPRMPPSRQKTLQMLKVLLTATHDLDSVLMVTTMWDILHSQVRRNRAEKNFLQVSELSQDFTDRGAGITRFLNTKASALEILDRPLHKKRAFDVVGFTTTPHLYQNLREYIELTIRERHNIEAQPEVKTPMLDRNLRENEQRLDKFIEQFIEYGPPPAQFADDHQRLCELVLSVRPGLQHCLPPSVVISSNDTPFTATGDQMNGTPQSELHTTGFRRLLKRFSGFKR